MKSGFDNHRHRPNLKGLTAIELLVATALSAMLIVSILGLLTNMNRQSRELMKRCHSEPWKQLLSEQLHRDLANTKRILATPNRLELSGYLGTHGIGNCQTLRAATVTYHLAPFGESLCLLRDERALDPNSVSPQSRRLVATGIDGFRLRLAATDKSDGNYAGPVPSSCRVEFSEHSSTTPIATVQWCQ